MEQCPVCDSVGIVDFDKPCYWCGLKFTELANGKKVAVVPGHFLLSRAASGAAIYRLLALAKCVVLDLSQVVSLGDDAIHVLVALHIAIKETGPKLILSRVEPNVMAVFKYAPRQQNLWVDSGSGRAPRL